MYFSEENPVLESLHGVFFPLLLSVDNDQIVLFPAGCQMTAPAGLGTNFSNKLSHFVVFTELSILRTKVFELVLALYNNKGQKEGIISLLLLLLFLSWS